MAKQEVAPRRLSSAATAPAPQRGTRRALISRLRRRRALFPCNTPTPSGQTTPARLQRTCWASPSYPRQRCSLPLTRLHHRPSTKRYRPIPILCLLDSASTHQATSLWWKEFLRVAYKNRWKTFRVKQTDQHPADSLSLRPPLLYWPVDWPILYFSDRKSTRLNSSHITRSRMPSSA